MSLAVVTTNGASCSFSILLVVSEPQVGVSQLAADSVTGLSSRCAKGAPLWIALRPTDRRCSTANSRSI